jgi:hypothetical protein
MTRPLDRDHPSSSQVWLDVVSAVDYLSKGHRPGFTVYDALEEALRWHSLLSIDSYRSESFGPEAPELPWDDPDPLRAVLQQLLSDPPMIDQESTTADIVHDALRAWVRRMAERHNDGRGWAPGRSAFVVHRWWCDTRARESLAGRFRRLAWNGVQRDLAHTRCDWGSAEWEVGSTPIAVGLRPPGDPVACAPPRMPRATP